MSFGAGMGAGMGAGIGAGIAIGMASGQKNALEQIREYLITHELTIHDSSGNEVSPESLLDEAVAASEITSRKWGHTALVFALLAGVALFGTIVYLVLH
ncbi:unnamed protein product [marine sediment metagenome]|jgi:hypothetical protein|uniref:Uncharacterized protein n=1 Tax=marine sediment metagenome TaxID=412755 RepID=X1B5N0_9ZZZZ